MTTDPPAPEAGDEEPMDLEDFLKSLGEVEHDEDLIDLTGSGLDVEVPDGGLEQMVADALSQWRKNVDSQPMSPKLENLEEQYVSIQENAAKLRAIAGRTAVVGAIQQAVQQLEEDQAEAIIALDPSGISVDAMQISGAFEAAKMALTEAVGIVQAAYAAAGDMGCQARRLIHKDETRSGASAREACADESTVETEGAMTFPAFRFTPPMDYVSADGIDTWLFHRGFETWSKRRAIKKAVSEQGGFTFKFGDTTYALAETYVDGEASYAIWFDQITGSMR